MKNVVLKEKREKREKYKKVTVEITKKDFKTFLKLKSEIPEITHYDLYYIGLKQFEKYILKTKK